MNYDEINRELDRLENGMLEYLDSPLFSNKVKISIIDNYFKGGEELELPCKSCSDQDNNCQKVGCVKVGEYISAVNAEFKMSNTRKIAVIESIRSILEEKLGFAPLFKDVFILGYTDDNKSVRASIGGHEYNYVEIPLQGRRLTTFMDDELLELRL